MEYVIYGIITGCILIIASIGFSMVWKTENFLNIAHGQMLLIGAYMAYLFKSVLNFPFALAMILSVIATAVLGLLLAKVFYFPVRKNGILVLLFTSIGLSWVIYGIVQAIVGPQIRTFGLETSNMIEVFGSQILSYQELFIILISLACVSFLHYILTKTKNGKGFRAMAENRDLAQIRGINSKKLSNYVWLISSGLAGLAGILLAMTGTLNMELGWHQILIIMSVVIVGGMGNLYGTMLAALIIGLSMDVSTMIVPTSYRTAIAFVIVILVLLIRPQGLSKGGAH
ncbi:branched-chain amino acid ABC transporter permease [Neobacillus sp. YX16]|jgi:branched-subunit amino acid ABC-type transport system permease component|uniref:branched-chain amino acid ABC transporter permease n=1 Tax=Neobacillus sp. YX16 TaxID=3047874 RepID=UPI0024C30F0E|nr:branched-chain amino acid ABC transporter permease [Neobacillus sp. YX16]WHZ00906.1 branched-chain amino acid ABC transporter permease [Neobacillus sp. YX16]